MTGSVGKTSTKDLLAAVLATTYVTAANERSFNNELGLPLTLLGAPDDTEAVVVEMGARGIGHIELLCDIARPTVGIVTRVEGVHLELFGDLDAVAQAKGELIEALPADGLAVLNADHPVVAAMAAAQRRPGDRPSASPRAPMCTPSNIVMDAELRARFTLHTPWGTAEVALEARGEHQVANALAAAAAAGGIGVSVEQIAAGLGGAAISGLRMELSRTDAGVADPQRRLQRQPDIDVGRARFVCHARRGAPGRGARGDGRAGRQRCGRTPGHHRAGALRWVSR